LRRSELQTELKCTAGDRHRAADAITAYQQAYPSTLRFVYDAECEKPFRPRDLYDGRFTYLKTDA
jgi:hypothetical protein